MEKINSHQLKEEVWTSPKGKFASGDKELSIGLGRKVDSSDHLERHPFDVEICRIPPGKIGCPFHSHSAQWEFYHVISGAGKVRDEKGLTAVESGDAFIFKPGQAHQIINDSAADLILYIVADNPIGESCHYPDSEKWLIRSPDRQLIRSAGLDYLDGEE